MATQLDWKHIELIAELEHEADNRDLPAVTRLLLATAAHALRGGGQYS